MALRSKRRWLTRCAAVLLAIGFFACSGPSAPSAGSKDGGDATNDSAASKPPIQIDFLWMIDHSASMCQEQVQLAKAFQGFVTTLESAAVAAGAGGIDAQMAVVTVQQLKDAQEIKKVGQFVHKAAPDFPPACIERSIHPCLKDADCTNAVPYQFQTYNPAASMCPEGGTLTVEPLPQASYACKANTVNPQFNSAENCALFTTCQFRCSTDADCQAMFEPDVPAGKHTVKCNKATTTPGCMFPPPTKDCPPDTELPAVVKQSQPLTDAGGKVVGSQLDWFHCLASVGAIQVKEAKFEGGLRSLWQALDPNGNNCPHDADGNPTADCQYQQLVRTGALLVLVAVSDDDDCSYAFDITLDPAKDVPFSDQFQTFCQMFGDAQAGNADLNNGRCMTLQDADKKEGKPPRTCATDCLPLPAGSAERANCETAAAVTMAELVASDKFVTTNLVAGVGDFVQRFQSLKTKPERVLFAAITGDSTATAGKNGLSLADQKTMDRALYYRLQAKDKAAFVWPYICNGPTGEVGYGSRYFAVAKAMGASGFAYNLCEPSGLGATLQTLAGDIAKRAVQLGM